MRMGSEKRPPEDEGPSVGGAGRSFFVGGCPSNPGFVDACLASSERRRGGFDGPDLEPL